MPQSVTVATGSRLHFGPFAYGNRSGPRFGGLGVMLDSPGCRVVASRSAADEIVAADSIRELIRRLVDRYRQSRPAAIGETDLNGVRVESPDMIHRHRGYGSGTQLALAVGEALHVLQFGEPAPAEQIASALGRGKRSAIGIHGFAHGGFVVDGGKTTDDAAGRLEHRLEFPAEWRFVLITPPLDSAMRGAKEAAAFRELSAMPETTSEHLRRLAERNIVPSIRNADFDTFAPALFEFGATVGDFFSPVQGGRFAHPAAEELVVELRRRGCPGVAQSSWGPTLAVAVRDIVEAESLTAYLQSRAKWAECVVRISAARNRPAEIAVTA